MAKYKNDNHKIEACQLPAENESADSFMAWAESIGFENYTSERDGSMELQTRDGPMAAMPGDWIILAEGTGFFACKPDMFPLIYRKVA